MNRLRFRVAWNAILLLLILFGGTAAALDTPQAIIRHAEGSGGQQAAAGPFILDGTLGEPIAGPFVAAGGFRLSSGYWQGITYDIDSDGDGIPDIIELAGCVDPEDADTDDDGLLDGEEDVNQNGQLDSGETDPCDSDSDGDGVQDGTELGRTTGHPTDTDPAIFQPDLDPATTTDPLNPDTDGDGLKDGEEDRNGNGRVDPGETNPKVKDQGTFFLIPNPGGGGAVIYLR